MSATDLSNKLLEWEAARKEHEEEGRALAGLIDRFAFSDFPDTIPLTREESIQLAQHWREADRLQSLKAALSRELLGLTPFVIADSKAHRIAHQLRAEAMEQEIEDGWEGELGWFDTLLGTFYPSSIAANLASLKPLIVLFEPPENLEALVKEALSAYCLELPTAAVALSRSIVEATVVDIAVKIGRVEDEVEIGKMRMCERISSLIDKSASRQSPLRQGIDRFMETASEIVHGNQGASMNTAREHLEAAFDLVNRLYVQYRAQYPH